MKSPDGRFEFSAEVPASTAPPPHQPPIDPTRCLDARGCLHICPFCNCRELFVRKDFPQRLGLGIVVLAGAIALTLFACNQVLLGFLTLASVVFVDALAWFFVGQCVVCYRCRAQFRNLPISPSLGPWDLALGEKYRPPPGRSSNYPGYPGYPGDTPPSRPPDPLGTSPE